MLDSDRDTVNTCGNTVHLAGFAACRGLGESVSAYAAAADVAAVSGAAFAVRRELFARLGGFDECFFLYVEDTDLSWRAWLAGARCRYVPHSVVAHQYTLHVSAGKFYYLERNRAQMLIKSLTGRTLVILAPALLACEAMIWGYALLRGRAYVAAKARAVRWLWEYRTDLRARRRAVQAERVTGDDVLLAHMGVRLPLPTMRSSFLTHAAVRGASAGFALLRRVARAAA